MISYNVTTAILGISAALTLFYLIRRHSIYVRHTIWWLGTCAAILVFSIFPKLSDVIVQATGVSYPPALFFFAAILLLFIKNLFMDIDRSKQEVRIRRLIQRLALVEAQLEAERNKAKTSK